MKNSMKLHIDTEVFEEGKIIQTVLLKESNAVVESIIKTIYDVREKQI